MGLSGVGLLHAEEVVRFALADACYCRVLCCWSSPQMETFFLLVEYLRPRVCEHVCTYTL